MMTVTATNIIDILYYYYKEYILTRELEVSLKLYSGRGLEVLLTSECVWCSLFPNQIYNFHILIGI